jgi:adenine phosphoribosyltransferase
MAAPGQPNISGWRVVAATMPLAAAAAPFCHNDAACPRIILRARGLPFRQFFRSISMTIKSLIRTVPHYPKQGVMYRDITTLLNDPVGFGNTISDLVQRYKELKIDRVAGIESRGFIIGAPLALQLGAGFIPIRKAGKLPSQTIGHEYELEYGTDRIEMHVDAVNKGERILLVDDLIASGGTAEAACSLIEAVGGEVVECAFVIDLPYVGGRKRLEARGYSVFSLCEFNDEN